MQDTLIFTKFGGKVAHGPRKKPLDFGGNPDHLTLDLGSLLRVAMPRSTWSCMLPGVWN